MPVYLSQPRVWGFTALFTNFILSVWAPDYSDLTVSRTALDTTIAGSIENSKIVKIS